MRGLVVTTLVVLVALATTVRADEPRDNPEAESLTAKELRKYIAPYVPGIRDCYLAKAKLGPGTLRLELIIHRDGSVVRFGFTASKASATARQQLDRCLRPLSETWHFPVRRGFTTAVIPFHFVQAHGQGATPQREGDR